MHFIMNKNSIVAKVDVYTGEIQVIGNLPIGFINIQRWIQDRSKILCVRNLESFLDSIGIHMIQDIIEVTHCVSLSDSFWIKGKNSKLTWDDVSPFRHNYSSVISAYALDGEVLGINSKNYFSPVLGTNGTFPHTWKYNNGNITFIKGSSKYKLGGLNSGMEPFSEYYAAVVAKYLNFRHVDYTVRKHKRTDNRIDVVTECKCYTTEEVGAVSADKIGIKSYKQLIEFSKTISDRAFNDCLNMLFLDVLLLNTDRHFGNIEFMIDNDTLEIIDIAPIFDNNYALLPRFLDDRGEIFNRSDYIARDNNTFESLYKLILNYKTFNNELIKLKSLKLEQPRKVSIPDTRLEFLNRFIQAQVNYLSTLR